jgi:type II secretory ATPase GspE/PulE/Tfp pilus assembly ATPase PilB-like protein
MLNEEIVKAGNAQGMRTLFEDGLQKVIKGITTINELERVIKETVQSNVTK